VNVTPFIANAIEFFTCFLVLVDRQEFFAPNFEVELSLLFLIEVVGVVLVHPDEPVENLEVGVPAIDQQIRAFPALQVELDVLQVVGMRTARSVAPSYLRGLSELVHKLLPQGLYDFLERFALLYPQTVFREEVKSRRILDRCLYLDFRHEC
jgi:hypothetical protein